MGKIKQLELEKLDMKVLNSCRRRKYRTQQGAINSSFAIELNTGKRMTTPEYCKKCQSWHTRTM